MLCQTCMTFSKIVSSLERERERERERDSGRDIVTHIDTNAAFLRNFDLA